MRRRRRERVAGTVFASRFVDRRRAAGSGRRSSATTVLVDDGPRARRWPVRRGCGSAVDVQCARRWRAGGGRARRGDRVEGAGRGRVARAAAAPHPCCAAARRARSRSIAAALADPDAVARGWIAPARPRAAEPSYPSRGRRSVDAARADAAARDGPRPTCSPALEDWGFDAEATRAWMRSGVRRPACRRAGGARRATSGPTCARRRARLTRPSSCVAMRQVLAREHDHASTCCPASRPSGSASTSQCTTCRCAPGRSRSRCAGTAPGRRCCGTCPPGSRCACRRSIRSGRRPAARAKRCSRRRRRRCSRWGPPRGAASTSPSVRIERRPAQRCRAIERWSMEPHERRRRLRSGRALRPGREPTRALRLAVLRFFTDDVGASIPEIVQALEEDRLLSMAAFRTSGPEVARLTLAQVAERARRERRRWRARVWRAAGFPDPRPFERSFGDADVALLGLIRIVRELVGEEATLQLVRTLGSALPAQIAEAEIALVRSRMEAPLFADGSSSRSRATTATSLSALLPRIVDAIDTLAPAPGRSHRPPLLGRARRPRTSSARGRVRRPERLHRDLRRSSIPMQLGLMLDRFEADDRRCRRRRRRECRQAHRRRGDVRHERARHRVHARPRSRRRVRGAARCRSCASASRSATSSCGSGDFYGPTVNLAARLVAAAEPGTVLADADLHSRLGRIRDRVHVRARAAASRSPGSTRRSRRSSSSAPERGDARGHESWSVRSPTGGARR